MTWVRLVGWSALLGVGAGLALMVLGPLLLVAVALVPLRVGVPLTEMVLGWLRGLADLHRLWAVRVMGTPIPRPYQGSGSVVADPATWRDVRWLPANFLAGTVLAGSPAMCGVLTVAGVGFFIRGEVDRNHYFPARLWVLAIITVLSLAGMWLLARRAMRWYAAFLAWSLGPAQASRLASRIDELTQSRAETLDTAAAEIRRIERDLHDGAQARLVSLGMSLGMAEKLLVNDPAAALQLLADAKQSTGHALSELRELVHGIHPPILADRGLDGAAHAVALSCSLPVTVTVELPSRAPAPVESAVYFALTEVLANVTKHSAATTAWIRIGYRMGLLSVMVADNGMGGAVSVAGGGLHGIERRLTAFDGTISVVSPAGGPTIVTMEVPCELVSASC